MVKSSMFSSAHHIQLPLPPPLFNASERSILQDARELIGNAILVQNSIGSKITCQTATFVNTLLPIAHEESHRLYQRHKLEFYQHVSTNEKVRDASREAQKMFSNLDTELAMRKDIYVLVNAVRERGEALDVESRRFLDRQMLQYRRNGLQLAEPDRFRLHQIKQDLEEARAEFEKNLSEENGGIWFSREELDGLPSDVLDDLENDDKDNLRLTFQPTHVGPAMQYVNNSAIRRRVYIGNANKCNNNVPLLEKTLILRDEAARLLGYAHHASFRLEDKMEKSPAKITAFLEDIRSRLAPKGQAELQRLKRLKGEDLRARGEDDDGMFYLWDHAYYARLVVQSDFAVDQQKISEYFPLGWTIQRMLGIFERVFGMKFVAIDADQLAHGGSGGESLVWHEDVRMFGAWDDRDEEDGGKEFLGYLYMDLHPRAGKHGHLADLSVHPVATPSLHVPHPVLTVHARRATSPLPAPACTRPQPSSAPSPNRRKPNPPSSPTSTSGLSSTSSATEFMILCQRQSLRVFTARQQRRISVRYRARCWRSGVGCLKFWYRWDGTGVV